MLPTLFLSHGAPDLVLGDSPARGFLTSLSSMVAKPEAILIISAHWETAGPTVNSVAVNSTIHDFRGFPEALYAIKYPAPGSPGLASRVVEALRQHGIEASADKCRGLDHGRLGAAFACLPLR
jgi:4,5-DOPA dioxygenase extradiol